MDEDDSGHEELNEKHHYFLPLKEVLFSTCWTRLKVYKDLQQGQLWTRAAQISVCVWRTSKASIISKINIKKERIICFSEKQMIKEFITTKPGLQETLKGLLQAEKKWC